MWIYILNFTRLKEILVIFCHMKWMCVCVFCVVVVVVHRSTEHLSWSSLTVVNSIHQLLVIAVINVHMNAVTIQMALASSEVMKVSCFNDVHYDGLSICSSFTSSAKWKVVRCGISSLLILFKCDRRTQLDVTLTFRVIKSM